MFQVESDIRGLVFDWDGTVVNTMPMHYLAWQETVCAFGADFPEDLFYELGGVPSTRIVQVLNERFGYRLDPDSVAEAKERYYRDNLLARVQPVEKVLAIVKYYYGKLPMAVATGAVRSLLEPSMAALNLGRYFQASVTADDVAHPKPAPDTFLQAAQALNLPPESCHAFEDSDLGLEAARRAGMRVTDIRPWLR